MTARPYTPEKYSSPSCQRGLSAQAKPSAGTRGGWDPAWARPSGNQGDNPCRHVLIEASETGAGTSATPCGLHAAGDLGALPHDTCVSYDGRMTATTISFRADEQTMAELRQLAGDGNLSDAIRDLIHAQYTARLYAQAARDAERLRNDPADLAEIKTVNEELDEISAW
jgi:hypothetical protein